MEHYPFTKCLNPRRIFNPYTLESMVVECGNCPACALRKSSLSAMKVKLESLTHKFSMFVSLTYNNVSLPLMLIRSVTSDISVYGEVVDSQCLGVAVDITTRLGTQGLVLGNVYDMDFTCNCLNKKTNTHPSILPHLSLYDAQLFIKRLRRNLDKYFIRNYGKKAPQIRYYLVGEYGPVHFRPHYHVILWFDDDEIYKIIREILHKSWPFGRIDCQKSLGKCADYVAKYLNSSVSLPQIFQERAVRPFAVHSSHLGEKVFEATREEIYENEFESVIKRSIPYFSTDSDVTMWRSLKTYYFPKCKGYSTKSEQERLYTYKLYVTAYRWTGETCLATQARIIVNSMLIRYYNLDMADDIYYYDDTLLDYFVKSSMFNPRDNKDKPLEHYIDDIFRRVYMELRLSKHFHRFVCKGFLNLYKPMLEKIDKFWSDNELYNLKNQIQDIYDYCLSDWFENEEDLQFFYHNRGFDLDKFKQTKVYNTFVEVTTKNATNAVKHKKLNDANNIFRDR